ncbi:uncharacterized protein Z519_11743 [Cladophialophora bantiana CBS 173.52]|uniref:Bulb-type lectin domain-containing protein n=1 Tax=Cladophialophora bantiana (strain ATCC 10958 / CBS 173.52 / CDC B-1940 / NIH 8579) TaxID=1442370 RepID=A0A0D2HTK4_CLAB1|nr:uncharacterized protein Z519_11743 [Cladophialophora bantiana CBS 173.52]KIW87769.1 hypothetical protein Z519_11743 [Cladophialophora bantiana CBS 173.52]
MPKGDHDRARNKFSEWMKYIPDNYSIAQLTLPGTHDSHATKENTPELMHLFTVCQFHSVTRQLELGVRYLDLRVDDPSLSMVHGYITLSGNLSDMLGEIREFLRTPSSETVLVSIKWDDLKSTHDQSLRHFAWNAWETSDWYKQKTWPNLKTAQGKAILLRRFESEGKDEIGIDCMGFCGSKSAGDKAVAPRLQTDNPAEAGIPFESWWDRALLNMNHSRNQPSSDGILYISNPADTRIRKGENPPIASAANVNWRLWNPSWKGNGSVVADFSSTKEAVKIFIQTDGDLVVYAKNGADARWASMMNMAQADKKRLSFQDDGNLVIYENGDGRWSLDRFACNSKLRVMHGPLFFTVDSDF